MNEAIIYLFCLPCTPGEQPFSYPKEQERYYTWHFSMQGLPFRRVTVAERGLLPHIFIFTPEVFLKNENHARGCYFLWHFLFPDFYDQEAPLSRGALLFAVRTFLPKWKLER